MVRQIIPDLVGEIRTNYKVIKPTHNNKHGKKQYVCECICGNIFIALASSIHTERTYSCGCIKRISPKRENLAGKIFDRLTALKRVEDNKFGQSQYLCVCECGNTKIIQGAKLKNKETRSCGCLQKETVGNHNRTHGMSCSSEYQSWIDMKHRCHNKKASDYKYYGAKGIKVNQKWRRSFKQFYVDMGNKPDSSYTIERLDGSKGYEPDNCVWATRAQQSRNLSSTRFIKYKGELLCMKDVAEKAGIKYSTLANRLNKLGWNITEALNKKVRVLRK